MEVFWVRNRMLIIERWIIKEEVVGYRVYCWNYLLYTVNKAMTSSVMSHTVVSVLSVYTSMLKPSVCETSLVVVFNTLSKSSCFVLNLVNRRTMPWLLSMYSFSTSFVLALSMRPYNLLTFSWSQVEMLSSNKSLCFLKFLSEMSLAVNAFTSLISS